MEWITALLKHFAISKLAIAALFVTSFVLYFGVDPVSKEWSFVVVAVLVFSGFILFIWILTSIWESTKQQFASVFKKINSRHLSQEERAFLYFLGEHPSESMDLDEINYKDKSYSRLELLDLVNNLEKKGLVYLNPYSVSESVLLTSMGRQRALEIQRTLKKTTQ